MAICQAVSKVSFEQSQLPRSVKSLGLNARQVVPVFVKFTRLTCLESYFQPASTEKDTWFGC